MKPRDIALLWIATVVVCVVLLMWGVTSWRSLVTRGSQAASRRAELTGAIKDKQEAMMTALRSRGLLQEVQWSAERSDPSLFLTSLAELAQGTRAKILAIGPVERQTTQHFVKTWQTVQVVAPYHDLRQLAARIEGNKGILEDVSLETLKETPTSAPRHEVHGSFKIATLEFTPDTRRVLQRVQSMTQAMPPAPPMPPSPLTLPVPVQPTAAADDQRDPFRFAAAPVQERPARAMAAASRRPFAAPAERPADKPEPADALEVRGIMSMPDGYVAIINNDIVRTGDAIGSGRVERITATTVVVRRTDGSSRTLALPAITVPRPDKETTRQ